MAYFRTRVTEPVTRFTSRNIPVRLVARCKALGARRRVPAEQVVNEALDLGLPLLERQRRNKEGNR